MEAYAVPPGPRFTKLEVTGDVPGPRCGHTLTPTTGSDGQPKLLLFGGATSLETPGGPNPSGGVASSTVHVYDVNTRVWTKIEPKGESPSPRAAHAAAAVGSMVVIQGGIGPTGLASGDLHVLDLSQENVKWHHISVAGPGPGSRYAHVMALVAKRFLLCLGGNDGRRALGDVWALDTAAKPYVWTRVVPEGISPPPRMYAACSARSDGLLLLSGGRDGNNMALSDAYGLARHRDGRWEWAAAPGTSPAPRYQHSAAFTGARLHVLGGAQGGGKMVSGAASVAVLDTAVGAWWPPPEQKDSTANIFKRCRHASAVVGETIYSFGGLCGGVLMDDMLAGEDTGAISAMMAPTASAPTVPASPQTPGTPTGFESKRELSLTAAAAAEAEAARFMASKLSRAEDGSGGNSRENRESSPIGGVQDARKVADEVRLHHRAVVVPATALGDQVGIMRQLSIDQLGHEARRSHYMGDDGRYHSPLISRREPSIAGVHKLVLANLLKPREWIPPEDGRFFLNYNQIDEMCNLVEYIFEREPSVLKLRAPIKIFGDVHGQFGDVMRLFDEYGSPSTAGDISYIDYLFLGDYVDRGMYSLETMCLLMALKLEHPKSIHLIRGNHEAKDINKLFGFKSECCERLGEKAGTAAWKRFNKMFNWMPLAALIEDKILCMHGGIGRSIEKVEDIAALRRPLKMKDGGEILMDLLWSDPTDNDGIEGIHPNPRGPGLVSYGPDRVKSFCAANKLQMIVRAHECVMDGFERFAQGHLITVFSATNYCGTANNAGAILVLGKNLVVVPKLIHPLPPPVIMNTDPNDRRAYWNADVNEQRPPTPPRGRPHPNSQKSPFI
eukprot:jgi/Mesvir1/20604/Mv14835-RA.2